MLVAIGAGGSVYALMSDDGKKRRPPQPPPRPHPTRRPPRPPTVRRPPPARPPATSRRTATDLIPEAYLGTWSGTIDSAAGHSTRELVIQQGEVGRTVLTLTAKGPMDTGGTYRCVFQADLTAEPSPDGPISIGPSTVTLGEPMSSCTPGKATTLTLLPDGTLRREITETGEHLMYTKSG